MWFLDSVCSRHMTGDASLFIEFVKEECGFTMYEYNNDKILREGVLRNSFTVIIYGVLSVKWLKHNLFSTSRLCDKGYFITVDTLNCTIEHKSDKEIMFKGSGIDNIYMLNLKDVSNICNKCSLPR